MIPAPAAPRNSAPRFWLTHAGFGLALGAAIATLNFAHYFPLTPALADVGVRSFASLLPEWCGEGVVLALVIGLAERRAQPRELRAGELALAVAAGSLAGVLLWQTFTLYVLHDVLGIRLLRDYMGVPLRWLPGVFFHGWLMLFFGGLAVAVQASRRRRTRMQAALLAAELRRASAQQGLAAARLAALRMQVAPDFLLDTLTRLAGLYETDPVAADRLLDQLIAFLRRVLAGIRAAQGNPDDAASAAFAPNAWNAAP